MSLWWLTYGRHGRLHGAVIVEAASLTSACVGVADNALDRGVSFVEGHELDAERARRIPPGYVGMMLSCKEAERLLDRVEQSSWRSSTVEGPCRSRERHDGPQPPRQPARRRAKRQ